METTEPGPTVLCGSEIDTGRRIQVESKGEGAKRRKRAIKLCKEEQR